MKKNILLSIFVFLGLITFAFSVYAGTIDSVNKYAWSTNIGWINFGCTNCNVNITNDSITGYAWSNNYGWINLSPTSYGVHNDGSGNLSGYAWGQNCGWINFSGVSIDTSNGKFSGTAAGNIIGSINFSCTAVGCPVTTDWRPSSGVCGDGICSSNTGETCENCPADCGTCGGGHNECVAQKCQPVPGSGVNKCNNDNDCAVVCSTDSDCGTNALTGSPFCQNGNAYQNYITYTCNNPGLTSSTCSNSTNEQLVATCSSSQVCHNGSCVICSADSDCGTSNYTGPLFCQNGNVYQNYITYTCNNPGLTSSTCSDSTDAKLATTCSSSQTCDNGSCVNPNVACSEDIDCGTNDYNGSPFCKDSDITNIYKNYITYTCNNPGASNSSCSNSTDAKIITTCPSDQTCDNGSCVSPGVKHKECNGSACVPVDGAGTDQCQVDSDCMVGPPPPPIVTEKHNECNAQQQCIPVDGAGKNQCLVNNDCTTVNQIITQPIETITKATQEQIVKPTKIVVQVTKKIVETPQGSVVTKTVSTTGILVATVTAVSSFSFFDIFLLLLRLIDLLLIALGLKKKVLPWGVVYDSVTKQPLDPAYVTLKDLQGKDVASAITDLDGRYGFLADPGIYQIQANKTNYIFPSQKLAGKTKDELYENLYFGEKVEVKKSGEVIIKNIPMDPLKFDWNEFAKRKNKMMIFYSKWSFVLRKLYDFLFVLGFVFAIFAYIFAPYPYNTAVVAIYLLLLLFRTLGLKPRTYGYITDKTTGAPLSFAIIRVMLPGSNVQVASKSANKYGKYYCLVSSGRYYINIEKKNPDGSYSLVYTSQVIDVSKKGIINNRFKV